MNVHEKLNYVEFPAKNLVATKVFFSKVFGWEFEDFGPEGAEPEYTAFSHQGIDGGFYKANLASNSASGAALLVFYSEDIESTLKKIQQAGGAIVKPIFSFPGGRRFHFSEPSGNELAVWSDQGIA